jgi:hypothetical protein
MSRHKCYQQVSDALAHIVVTLPLPRIVPKNVDGLDTLIYVAGELGLDKSVVDEVVNSVYKVQRR